MIARIIQIVFLLIFAVANAITVIVSHNVPWIVVSAIISAICFWSAFVLIVYEIDDRYDRLPHAPARYHDPEK